MSLIFDLCEKIAIFVGCACLLATLWTLKL